MFTGSSSQGERSRCRRAKAVGLGYAAAAVAYNYLSRTDEADRVMEEIRGFGIQAFAAKADVRTEDQVQAMFQVKSGKVHYLTLSSIQSALVGMQR